MALPLLSPTPQDWGRTPAGLHVPAAAARRMRRPIGIDLFCGCGGFTLGFVQAGWEVVAGLDNDPWAALTYLVNLGAYPVQIHYAEPDDKDRLDKACKKSMGSRNGLLVPMTSGAARPEDQPGVSHFFFGDCRKFTGEQILAAIGRKRGEVDCVFGSPPCQGFSHAGKRNVMDPRNSLVFEFARLVLEMQPQSLCFENVPGILNMTTPEGLPVVDAFSRVLQDGGWGTLDAIKRALLTTAGAGVALKSQKPEGKQKRWQPGPRQAELEFDEEASPQP